MGTTPRYNIRVFILLSALSAQMALGILNKDRNHAHATLHCDLVIYNIFISQIGLIHIVQMYDVILLMTCTYLLGWIIVGWG